MPDAVVDTTVLIAFGHLDRFDLLPQLYGRVSAPDAVYREALRDPQYPEIPVIRQAVEAGLIRVEPDEAESLDPQLVGLGAGEAAVITLARDRGAIAVIDDWRARQAARSLGVTVIGTVGLLIQAQRRELVPAVLPLVEELRAAGFRIGPDELAAARAADAPP